MKQITCRKRRIFIPFAIAAFIFILSAIVMLLWNNILPDVLKVSTISYWQAMGILVLSKLLFGFHGPKGNPDMFWARKMHKKMQKMTSEEREKFKEEMKQRFAQWQMPNNPFNSQQH